MLAEQIQEDEQEQQLEKIKVEDSRELVARFSKFLWPDQVAEWPDLVNFFDQIWWN